jgi:hypothetical protein
VLIIFLKSKSKNTKTQNNFFLTFNENHLNGLNKRYKCRVRWYGDFYDFNSPILEFKEKVNQVTEKKRFI